MTPPPSQPSAAPLIASEPAQTSTPGDVSAPAPAAPSFLPDGTPLNLTLFGKITLGRLFGGDGDEWGGPQTPTQDVTLLYIAANDKRVWMTVGPDSVTGAFLPLIQRPTDFQMAVADFADSPRLAGLTVQQMSDLAIAVWKNEHVTQVIPVQKKSPEEFPDLTTTAASGLTGPSNI